MAGTKVFQFYLLEGNNAMYISSKKETHTAHVFGCPGLRILESFLKSYHPRVAAHIFNSPSTRSSGK
jgi:hypothetical protein